MRYFLAAALFTLGAPAGATVITFNEAVTPHVYPNPIKPWLTKGFQIGEVNFVPNDHTSAGVGGGRLGIGTEGYGVTLTSTAVGLGLSLSSLTLGTDSSFGSTIFIQYFAPGNFSYLSGYSNNAIGADKTEYFTLNNATPLQLQLDFSGAQAIRIGAGMSNFYVDNLDINIAAIPEPRSWAMMMAGFAVLGGLLRAGKLLRPLALSAV